MTKDPISSGGTRTRQPASGKAKHRSRRRLAPLPIGVRLLVLFVGGLLLIIGFAGLLLPGIQGIFTIVLGAAILSLASDWIYKLQRRILARWPAISDRMERFRHRLHDWLSRKPHEPKEPENLDPPETH